MNSTRARIGVVLAAALFATAIGAAKGLGQAEAERLFKGNTAEGVNSLGVQIIWYFDPSGELRKRDSRGNKGKAKWSINKRGEFCYLDKHIRNEQCVPVIPKEGGRYELPFANIQAKWNKVVPGNPHNL